MQTVQPCNNNDQLIRQTRVHHVQLSMMVDAKSNMLLTMSSIILTLAIPKLTDPQFRIAAAILMTSCLGTIGLSCYTVMPKLKHKKRANGKAPDLVSTPETNLLFFDDFASLNYDEFQTQMHTVLSDATVCYETQVREVYLLGKYLYHKKFPLLRLAYIVFFSGFLLTALQLAWILL